MRKSGVISELGRKEVIVINHEGKRQRIKRVRGMFEGQVVEYDEADSKPVRQTFNRFRALVSGAAVVFVLLIVSYILVIQSSKFQKTEAAMNDTSSVEKSTKVESTATPANPTNTPDLTPSDEQKEQSEGDNTAQNDTTVTENQNVVPSVGDSTSETKSEERKIIKKKKKVTTGRKNTSVESTTKPTDIPNGENTPAPADQGEILQTIPTPSVNTKPTPAQDQVPITDDSGNWDGQGVPY